MGCASPRAKAGYSLNVAKRDRFHQPATAHEKTVRAGIGFPRLVYFLMSLGQDLF